MNLINKAENISLNKENKFYVGSLDLVRDWSFAGDVAKAMIKIFQKMGSIIVMLLDLVQELL